MRSVAPPRPVRKLDHRAGNHVAARRPGYEADEAIARSAAQKFLDACLAGNVTDLMAIPASRRGAAQRRRQEAKVPRRAVEGPHEVASWLSAIAPRCPTCESASPTSTIGPRWSPSAPSALPRPAPLAVVAQQHLRHRQGDQLTVGQQRLATPTRARRHHMVVDQHVQCGQEGVQFFAHTSILNAVPHIHGSNAPRSSRNQLSSRDPRRVVGQARWRDPATTVGRSSHPATMLRIRWCRPERRAAHRAASPAGNPATPSNASGRGQQPTPSRALARSPGTRSEAAAVGTPHAARWWRDSPVDLHVCEGRRWRPGRAGRGLPVRRARRRAVGDSYQVAAARVTRPCRLTP